MPENNKPIHKIMDGFFFEPRLCPVFDEEIPDCEQRLRFYYLTCTNQSLDTTVYKFPAGFTAEIFRQLQLGCSFRNAYQHCHAAG